MKTPLLLLSLFSLALIFGCSSEKVDKKDKSDYQFKLTEKFKTFPLPADVGQLEPYFMPLGEDYFAIFDYKTKQILTYSIPESKLLNTIQLETEGPNGVGKNIAGIFADNPAEFFLTTASNQLFKIDSSGQIIHKVSFNTEELQEQGVSLFSNVFVRNQKEFYFAAFPLTFEWTSLAPEELTKTPNLLRYDSIENSFLPISYFPEEFVGTNLNKTIFPLLAVGPTGQPIINLNFRNIYYQEDEEIHSSFAGLSSFPEDPPTSPLPNMFEDMNEIMKMINHTDIYTDVYFLPAQDLIVRVAKHEDIPDNTLETDAFLASKWGLVFLDTDFNKVGELDLEADRFHGRYLFADQEGIWVSTDHPENPDIQEDFLRFQLIEVTK